MSVLLVLVIVVAALVVWHFTRPPAETGGPITRFEEPDDEPKKGVTPDADGWITLAPLVKVGRDTQNATWKVTADSAEFRAGRNRAYVSVPTFIEGGYEIRTNITITNATDALTIFLPVSPNRVMMVAVHGDKGECSVSNRHASFRWHQVCTAALVRPFLEGRHRVCVSLQGGRRSRTRFSGSHSRRCDGLSMVGQGR
jgi:hypothetical protein